MRYYDTDCQARTDLATGLGDLYDDCVNLDLHDAASSVSHAEDCIANAIQEIRETLKPSKAKILACILEHLEDSTDLDNVYDLQGDSVPLATATGLLEELLAEEENKHKMGLFR